MSDKLEWTRDLINRLKYPWHAARFYHIQFTEHDINYIETVIMTDNRYHYVVQNLNSYKQADGQDAKKYTVRERFYNFRLRGYMTEKIFFEEFMNRKDCPKNVHDFLCCHLGTLQYGLKSYGITNTDQQRLSFFIERWLETVCLRKPKKKAPCKRKNIQKFCKLAPTKLHINKNIDVFPMIYMLCSKHAQRRR